MPHPGSDALNQAPAGFLTFRDDGEVVAVNDTLLDLLGQERDAVVGHHVERLMGVAGRIFFQTHLFPLVRMHGRAEEIYLGLRHRDGEPVPVLLNARRVDDWDPAVTHCVLMRVKERAKFEDELLRAKKAAEEAHERERAANQAKSRYLRSVSHEIRTPINALLGYADLLELNADRPMGDRELGYVERVRQAGRHLLNLVNDLLDLARIEAGAMSVASDADDIARAIDAATGLVRGLAEEREIRLAAGATDGEIPHHANRPTRTVDAERQAAPSGRYIGDHGRVVQILVNLLSNAVKFTPRGGRVELSWDAVRDADPGARLERDGPWIRVRVSDTGVGIPPDRLDDIFEPFHQVEDEGSHTTPGGTGLGLAISRDLARLMDGDLTVRSQPGEGSTFTLWLPADS